MNPIEVCLVQGKETKGTYRFVAEDAQAPISTLYVRKTAFEGTVPKAIVLTVAPANG